MNQQPSIGRIVIAVIRSGRGEMVSRPAIIVNVTSASVAAQVFTDGEESYPGVVGGYDAMPNIVWKVALVHDEQGLKEDSWRWPVREISGETKLKSVPSVDWVSLYKDALELCYAIEKLPASGEATNLSLMASSLASKIQAASSPQA